MLPQNRLLPCFCLGLLRESASLGGLWAHPHWAAVAMACMLAAPALGICTSLPLLFQEDGVGHGASVGPVLLYCFGLCMAHGRIARGLKTRLLRSTLLLYREFKLQLFFNLNLSLFFFVTQCNK